MTLINTIIDTPKGSRNKFKYDEKTRIFKLGGPLPLGAVGNALTAASGLRNSSNTLRPSCLQIRCFNFALKIRSFDI
jgi:hypothetical protein